MNNVDLKALLEQSVARLDPNTVEHRLKVYRAAQKAFADVLKDQPAEVVEQRNREMIEVIKEIEARFNPPAVTPQKPVVESHMAPDVGVQDDVAASSPTNVPPTREPEIAVDRPSDTRNEAPAYMSELPEGEVRDDLSKARPAKKRRWGLLLLFPLLLLAALAIGWLYLSGTFNMAQDDEIGSAIAESEAVQEREVPANNNPDVRIIDTEANGTAASDTGSSTGNDSSTAGSSDIPLFYSDFSDGLDQFSRLSPNYEAQVKLEPEIGLLKTNGQVIITGKDLFEVNPESAYRMVVEFRPGEGETIDDVQLHAGFMTYDGDRKIETEPPGSHRYFAASGNVSGAQSLEDDGWYSISGIITGRAKDHSAFRNTSRFASPFLLINLNKPELHMDIRKVEVDRLD